MQQDVIHKAVPLPEERITPTTTATKAPYHDQRGRKQEDLSVMVLVVCSRRILFVYDNACGVGCLCFDEWCDDEGFIPQCDVVLAMLNGRT